MIKLCYALLLLYVLCKYSLIISILRPDPKWITLYSVNLTKVTAFEKGKEGKYLSNLPQKLTSDWLTELVKWLTNQRPSFWQEIALSRYVPSMLFSKNGNFSCDLMKKHEIKLPLFRHFSKNCTTYKCMYFLIGYICQIYILWSWDQEGSFFTE